MHDDHDHTKPTHTAACDEEGCSFVAKVHAHDDNTASSVLARVLAEHNKKEHEKDTNPEDILSDVKKKMSKKD